MQLAWKTIEANNDILIDKSAGEVLGSEDYTRKFIIFVDYKITCCMVAGALCFKWHWQYLQVFIKDLLCPVFFLVKAICCIFFDFFILAYNIFPSFEVFYEIQQANHFLS